MTFLVFAVAEVRGRVVVPARAEREVRDLLGKYICDEEGAELDLELVREPGPGRAAAAREDLTLWLDANRSRAQVMAGKSTGDRGAVDRALRLMFADALVRRGGILLHASAVLRSDGAVAFAGASGAGKSTIVRMFPAETWLGDDTVAVWNGNVYSTPFVNAPLTNPEPRHAPLREIVCVEHGDDDSPELLGGVAALTGVMANVLTGCAGWDASRALENVSRMRIPVSRWRRRMGARSCWTTPEGRFEW